MKNRIINVKGAEVTIATRFGQDYISLTDMLKAKDGDFFVSDWLRNRNTVELAIPRGLPRGRVLGLV